MRRSSRLCAFGLFIHLILVLHAAGQGIIVTAAGTDRVFPRSGPALSAPLDKIEGVVTDSSGNVYVADYNNNLVVKLARDGTLTVVAGNGIRSGGFSGDGGPATGASLKNPSSLAVDPNGNLYISDIGNRRIRKVSAQGIITTIAGNGQCCFDRDGGLATLAKLDEPSGIAVDLSGNVYISDHGSNRILKVTPAGIITTVAGNFQRATTGDGGPAASASLNGPWDVALDSNGNLYISERDGHRIRMITPAGTISTVAGNGLAGASGDGGPATSASFTNPHGIALDLSGNLYIADRNNHRTRKVNLQGIISTVAGGGGSLEDGVPATSASLVEPRDVAADAAGTLFIADTGNRRLRRVGALGIITTAAGNGRPRYTGDGGPATSAEFDEPRHIAVDSSGNLFIADVANSVIRKISRDGIISTVAGTGQRGYAGDGGQASSAVLRRPHGVAVGPDGSIYIADFDNQRVRKVSPQGIITTFAGGGATLGDNGPATSARLESPSGVALGAAGDVFISECGSNRVRKVTPAGTISTVAGTGQRGFAGDGGPATAASLNCASAVAVDGSGNVYISDGSNYRIRKVSQGTITTFAGTGQYGSSGDGGAATSATLSFPEGLAVDAAGNLYIADSGNHRVRRVTPQGIITTVAGSRAGFSGDGGLATGALLNSPWGLAVDGAGNLYIGEKVNNRIRAVLSRRPTISVSPTSLNFSAAAGTTGTAAQPLALNSDIPGLLWETSAVLTSSGGIWLRVSQNSGVMPATLFVTVDATNLAAGTYQGSIEISGAAAASPLTVTVTFTVTGALAPVLAIEPARISFQALVGGAAPPPQALRIDNNGSGTLNWAAQAAAAGGNWLAVSPASGSASPAQPGSVQVSVNPAGLAAGSYAGSVTVSSATTNQSIVVPVSLLVQPATGVLLLSQTHLLFRAIESGGTEPEQTFGVLNIGSGALDWTAESTQSWLRISPAAGRSAAGATQPPLVTVSVDPTNLRAGFYVGQIRVTSAGANNSPRVLRVDLHVLPARSRLGAVVRPTGLIFVVTAGGTAPGSQEVAVSTTERSPIEFVSQAIDGAWVTRAPDLSTASHGNPGRIVVQPEPGALAAGVYRAGLTVFTRNDGEQHPVRLLLLVLPAAGAISASGRQSLDSAACTSAELHLQFTTLFNNFNAVLGWPNNVLVNVRDNCGNAAVGGTVLLSFSSGEPSISLVELSNGLYQGSWTPSSAASPQLVLTARGLWRGLQGQASATATLGANPNPQLAVLSQGGVLLGAGFERGPVAPGSIVSLFGRNFAAAENLASTLPLPSSLGGARVLIGGVTAPLFYAGPFQVNAQVPWEVAPDRQIQVQVEANGVPTAPEPLQTAATRPGIFTVSGSSQGAILVANTSDLASPATPVRVGGHVSIYCTGLGATEPPAASGRPAPSAPLASVRSAVTVTIGGQPATVTFAGLAPGFVGVYQVNAQVPAGITLGDVVPVVITQGGFQSNAATIAVR